MEVYTTHLLMYKRAMLYQFHKYDFGEFCSSYKRLLLISCEVPHVKCNGSKNVY